MAVSSSGAAGIWQFIPSTGEKYGMRKNKGLDERFDFLKATEGALVYLKNPLRRIWKLVLCPWRPITVGRTDPERGGVPKTADYFRLDLSAETERYVYKIAAAKIILSIPSGTDFVSKKETSTILCDWKDSDRADQPLPLRKWQAAVEFTTKRSRR